MCADAATPGPNLLLHEVVYALLGHTGTVVVASRASEHQLELARDVPVDASERALLNRMLELGSCYRALDAFVSFYLFHTMLAPVSGARPSTTDFPPRSPFLLALANAVEECLRPYSARVLELEEQLLSSPAISAASLQLGFGQFELTLPALRRVIGAICTERLSGAALVDRLQAAASGASAAARSCLSVLLGHVHRALLAQLSGWLLYGQLPPAEAHFFIQPRDAAVATGAAAGAPADGTGGAPVGTRPDGRCAGQGEADWMSVEVRVELKPQLLPMRVAEKALFIGKAVRVLRSAAARGDTGAATSHGVGAEGGDEALGAARAMEQSFVAYGAELSGLGDAELHLEPLGRLLSRMQRRASELLWRHLLKECELMRLLHAVKDYFLLGRGELFHRLLDELQPHTAEPPSERLDLQSMLSLAASGGEPDPYFDRLTLSLAPSAAAEGAYDGWCRLRLRLHVGWPLQLLLDASSLERYNQLFSFLLTVKRVQKELHASWATQTTCRAVSAAQRSALFPMWRLRAHMSFVIDNLQYYLQVDVLEAQWRSLTACAQTCADFEALCAAHEAALGALLSQCFLQAAAAAHPFPGPRPHHMLTVALAPPWRQASSVTAALHQIFQLCLALCRLLAYAEAAERGSRADEACRAQFANISREFSRQSAFLFAFLSNMSSPQASPHLAQLLMRLNFNNFFVADSPA